MVSLVTVFRNEGQKLERFLSNLDRQWGCAELYEVLLVDNETKDVSASLAQRWCAVDPERRRYFRREYNHLGEARAQGIREARADLVVFLDADCYPNPGWLELLIAEFHKLKSLDPRTAAYGSPAAPDPSQTLGQAWHLMTMTIWGHLGSTQAFRPRRSTRVGHIPTANIIYERTSVLRVGNFSNEFADVCEDVDLNARLVRQGCSLYFGPHPSVTHHWAENWREWFQKIHRYGRGQLKVHRASTQEGKTSWNPYRILPLLVILYALAALVLLGTSVYWILPTIYLTMIVGISFFSAASQGLWIKTPLVVAAFLLTQTAYATGVIAGIWDRLCSFAKPLEASTESPWTEA